MLLQALDAIQRQPRWLLRAACLVGLAAAGLSDYLTADDLYLTAIYLIPLSIGAWHISRTFGLVLATAGAATYFANEALETPSHSLSVVMLDTLVEGAVYVTMVLLLASLKRHLELERQARAVAEQALADVRQLSALLPMCSSCKKIRDEPDESWVPFEVYLLKHSDSRVSHGICPECAAKLYPEQFKKLQDKKANAPK